MARLLSSSRSAALRLLARRKQQASLGELFGMVAWEGDLDAERRDDPERPAR